MLTFRLAVVHSLPSAIRFEEGAVPTLAALLSCAARRSNDALTEPTAILSASDTRQTRIGLAPSLMRVIAPFHCCRWRAGRNKLVEIGAKLDARNKLAGRR